VRGSGAVQYILPPYGVRPPFRGDQPLLGGCFQDCYDPGDLKGAGASGY